MSDENKIEVKEDCKCFCQSKGFRKFVVIATGTFVGVFCALSLFAALHKPPMPPCPCGCNPMIRPPMAAPCHFDRGHRGDFHQKIRHEKFAKKPPVRVEVQTED